MRAGEHIVFGWAVVSTRHGRPYFNTEDIHVPDAVMLKSAVGYMQDSREVRVMHDGNHAGTVVFAFPLTADIAKAMGIQSDQTGLMVGIRFDDPATLKRIAAGELIGLSPGFVEAQLGE